MHDPTKILLGTTQSSDRPATNVYASDPATFPAGTACRLGSDGLLTVTKGSNSWAGISLGASLSDTKKTCVLRLGSRVPLLLSSMSYAKVTITDFAKLVSGTDDVITVDGQDFTAQAGAATPGDPTFQAATSNDATAASLVAQINSHVTIGALVVASAVGPVVTIASILPGEDGDAITLVYTDNDVNIGATLQNATGGHLNGGAANTGQNSFVTLGGAVYIDDATGKATGDVAGATISNAVYVSGVLDGVKEDATSIPVALVDMVGGL